MNLNVAMQGGDRITRQRNLFLVMSILLGVTSSALSLKIFMQEERIVMVPPLQSEVVISNRRVSSGTLFGRVAVRLIFDAIIPFLQKRIFQMSSIYFVRKG